RWGAEVDPHEVRSSLMKRRRKPSRASARKRRRRRVARVAPPPPQPTEAERRLLALARELSALEGDALPRALDLLADAYGPEAPLPSALHQAWLAGRGHKTASPARARAARGNKTAVVALAWAREQVRLALEEILGAAPLGTRASLGVPAETRAWIVLAACEALAHEPASAVPDRVRALAELTRPPR